MIEKGMPFTLWLTGISGSGKTILARELEIKLKEMGRRVQVVDGDEIRAKIGRELGFEKKDRISSIIRGGKICKRLNARGIIAIAPYFSPYEEGRIVVRGMVPRHVEIFVNCPVEICRKRDPKGLYGKASKGELKNFADIVDAYERPKNPEITVNTHEMNVEESVNHILANLRERRLNR
ncbi:MAG: adenylyl-sulfate kinase [Candidatus Micrarchaeota archaeon]